MFYRTIYCYNIMMCVDEHVAGPSSSHKNSNFVFWWPHVSLGRYCTKESSARRVFENITSSDRKTTFRLVRFRAIYICKKTLGFRHDIRVIGRMGQPEVLEQVDAIID